MIEQKPKRVRKLPVMEIFGPTIQGEGMVVGQKTMFVRTGGCDYSCSWCDSAFTWNGTEKAKAMSAEEVFDKLVELGQVKDVPGALNFNHVTISGGNPALIGVPMKELIDLLKEENIKVGLETQGSRWQDWFYDISDLTISPKPPSSGMVTDFLMLDEIIDKLTNSKTYFTLKVVVFDDRDYEYARDIHKRYPHVEFFLSVGNEDSAEEGDISGRLLQKLDWLWDKVLNDEEMNDAKPLPQLHTLIWANKRSV